MTAAVQRRRGTAAQMAAFTGAQGEIAVDTDNDRVVVHDGVTAGGWPAAKLAEVPTSTSPLAVAAGGTGAATPAGARTNLGAAASGANSDITSLKSGVTIPTPPAGDSSQKIANMAALSTAVAAAVATILGNAPPALLQTLQAIDQALNNDPNFYNDIMAVIATKAAAGPNTDITSLGGLTTALSVTQGGTGGKTATAARTALSAAASGANADITSLAGLTTALSLGQGGTGATDAKGARAALGLDKATLVGDVAYAVLATDRTVLLTTALTAPRTWTLPAANGMNAGAALRITDQIGGISTTNTLTLATSGSDKINGAAAVTFTAPFTDFQLATDGAGRWTFDVQGLARGGTGATTAAAARANLGAAASGANADITSLAGLTTALSVSQGGTGATTANGARGTLGAAASGANSDITSLGGLTTPLSVGQGGSGAATPAAARASLGAAASGANTDITSLSMTGSATATGFVSTQAGGIALAMPTSGAIRDATNGASSIYFDVSAGGTANGQFFWRTSSAYTQLMVLNATALTVNTPLSVTGAATFGSPIALAKYTVATLPAAGTVGRVVHCSNARVFNGAGVQEGAGAGTGGTVSDNGSAWKIAGTNVTAAA